MSLVLHVVDLDGARPRERWRWSLTGDGGTELATHDVHLDATSAEFEAFHDLAGFVRRNRAPHDPVRSEAIILRRIGRWLGDTVLGPQISAALAAAAPTTVEVRLPPEGAFLAGAPLELGRLGDQPLTQLGLPLVFTVAPPASGSASTAGSASASTSGVVAAEVPGPGQPTRGTLRILAVFSLPSRSAVLAQRRERHELSRLVDELRSSGQAVELRVLQYGVTRQALAEAAGDPDGWAVLHVSSHGSAGRLELEQPNGRPDPVAAAELVELLRPAARGLRLVVLSACDSGASVAGETLRWLSLQEQADSLAEESPPPAPQAYPSVAQSIVAATGAAVVAMRYPVIDDFAVAFTGELYTRLMRDRKPLPVAFQEAVTASAGSLPTPDRRALCAVTPAMFGPRSLGLTAAPRRGPAVPPVPAPGAGLPPEPARFVGRIGMLLTANQALAPESPHRGVLFTGMAGAGKSACALEVAHQHAGRFELVSWWQAPPPSEDGVSDDGLFEQLAETWERQLGVPMVHALAGEADFEDATDQLRTVLTDRAVLLVLDNLETMLARDGSWRDARLGRLVEVVCTAPGRSRIILSSRLSPSGLPASIAAVATHALSLAEAALLGRELPHLSRLLHAAPDPGAGPDVVKADRRLFRRVLEVVQGHPKLMELADAVARDPGRLRERTDLAHARAAEGGAGLSAFFADGAAGLSETQFLSALDTWTTAALAGLPRAAVVLAEIIACAEPADRQPGMLDGAWPIFWERLEDGTAPPFDSLVEQLADANLVQIRTVEAADGFEIVNIRDVTGGPAAAQLYQTHPAVAEAIRRDLSRDRRDAIDEVLGNLHLTLLHHSVENEGGTETRAARVVAGAALGAAPYLVRCGRWSDLAFAISQIAVRHQSAATVRQVTAYLRRADGELDPRTRRTIRAVEGWKRGELDPAEGIVQLREVVTESRAAGDFRSAATAAGNLVNLLLAYRTPQEAAAANDEATDLLARSGAGPWTVLLSEVQRLQLGLRLGEAGRVLKLVPVLLQRMDTLPDTHGPNEAVAPWMVRETLLGVAMHAAVDLERWSLALRFNEQHQHSQFRRGAPSFERAKIAINAHVPLLELGRLADAERVLLRCQRAFEDEGDILHLGMVHGARASLESRRGRTEQAVMLQERALRYLYQRPTELTYLATAHANFAHCLEAGGGEQFTFTAHRFASALLQRAAGRPDEFSALIGPHRSLPDMAHILTEMIIPQVERTPGVRFARVFENAVPDPRERSRLLAATMATGLAVVLQQLVRDRARAGELAGFLDELACTAEWKPVVLATRQILAGRIDRAMIATLDDVSHGILAQVFG